MIPWMSPGESWAPLGRGSSGIGFAATLWRSFKVYRVMSPRGGAPLLTHGETPGEVEVIGRLVTGDPLDLTRREPGATAKGKEPGS